MMFCKQCKPLPKRAIGNLDFLRKEQNLGFHRASGDSFTLFTPSACSTDCNDNSEVPF